MALNVKVIGWGWINKHYRFVYVCDVSCSEWCLNNCVFMYHRTHESTTHGCTYMLWRSGSSWHCKVYRISRLLLRNNHLHSSDHKLYKNTKDQRFVRHCWYLFTRSLLIYNVFIICFVCCPQWFHPEVTPCRDFVISTNKHCIKWFVDYNYASVNYSSSNS